RKADAVDRTERVGFRRRTAAHDLLQRVLEAAETLARIFLHEVLHGEKRHTCGVRRFEFQYRGGGGTCVLFGQQIPERNPWARRRPHELLRIGMGGSGEYLARSRGL